jgi:hypothetical protein
VNVEGRVDADADVDVNRDVVPNTTVLIKRMEDIIVSCFKIEEITFGMGLQ